MSSPPEPSGLDHGFLRSGPVRLHYVTMGKGPLMLFLHGFPDFWYGWRHQLAEFAKDHRVVAIDMRGYNDSDKPAGREAYAMPNLIGDVGAVIDELGDGGKATLVGHDWGGVVAWSFAETHPKRLEKLVIINIPHPAVMAKAITRPPQLFRSWYMYMFQLPVVPEFMLTRNHGELMESVFRGGAVNREAFNNTDLAAYRDAICKPGVATATMNYYRNLFANAGRKVAGSRTSAANENAGYPLAEMAAATAAPPEPLWSRTKTCAPSSANRWATASTIPAAAPVMSATFPVSMGRGTSLL